MVNHKQNTQRRDNKDVSHQVTDVINSIVTVQMKMIRREILLLYITKIQFHSIQIIENAGLAVPGHL